jgi:methyl-accepting chemotaxis protein
MNNSRAVDLSLLALVVALILGAVFLQRAHEQRIEAEETRQLTTMLMLRESVLQSYLESLRSEVTLWSGRPIVRDILSRLNAQQRGGGMTAVEGVGALDATELENASDAHGVQTVDQVIRRFAKHHDYYDVFLIGPEGDVLLSVAREDDYGTNLIDGPYSDTGLGRLFASLMRSEEDIVAMEDFLLYPPSDNEPAAFLGAKVFSEGELIGVYAIQIPEQPINRIMDEVGVTIVDDYRGIPVYSAYRLFEFEGIRWAVLAEKDVSEVQAPISRARWWLAAAVVLAIIMVLVLRFMLVRIVLPTSIAALLGLSMLSMDSQADD